MGQAKRDAEKLFKAGEDRWGTDEEEFIRIFSTRHYYQLRATWNEYVKVKKVAANLTDYLFIFCFIEHNFLYWGHTCTVCVNVFITILSDITASNTS